MLERNIVNNKPIVADGLDQLLYSSMPNAFRHSTLGFNQGGQQEFQHIASSVTDWVIGASDTDPMLWLHGPDGVESVVAHKCVELLDSKDRLAASLFLSCSTRRNDPKRVFTSIAYQIAARFPHVSGLIRRKIYTDPAILTASLQEQFDELIAKPARVISQLLKRSTSFSQTMEGSIIFVHGLDECREINTQYEISEIIMMSIREQKTPFRWFITSLSTLHLHALRSNPESACLTLSIAPGLEQLFRRAMPHRLRSLVTVPNCQSEGSYQGLIDTIVEWGIGASYGTADILWLYGPSDASNSGASQASAKLLWERGHLGASLFLTSEQEDHDPRRIFPVIAHELAATLPHFARVVDLRIQEDASVLTATPAIQFEELLAEPLRRIATQLPFMPRLAIIVDGLSALGGRTKEMGSIVDLVVKSVLERTTPFCWLLTGGSTSYLESPVVDLLHMPSPGLEKLFCSSIRKISYSPESTQPPITQDGLLKRALDSALDTSDDAKSVMWMFGYPDFGRSAVVRSLTAILESKNKLGASLSLSKNNIQTDPHLVFTSISYQVATKSLSYANAVGMIAQGLNFSAVPLSALFAALFVEPFRLTATKCASLIGQVMVIDGLDEVGETEAQRTIMQIIAKSVREGMTPFRWLISSRTDTYIIGGLTPDDRNVIDFFPKPGLERLSSKIANNTYNLSISYHEDLGSRGSKITGWARTVLDPDARILWIFGPSGSRKSLAARRFGNFLASQNKLDAAFFFSNTGEQNDTPQVFTSIAYQLATKFPTFSDAVDRRIQEYPGILTGSLTLQFQQLLAEPLREVGSGFNDISWIILDGLTKPPGQKFSLEIVNVIKHFIQPDTVPLRWIISSRPHPQIIRAMMTEPKFIRLLPLATPGLDRLREDSLVIPTVSHLPEPSPQPLRNLQEELVATVTDWALADSGNDQPILWIYGPLGFSHSLGIQKIAGLLESEYKLSAYVVSPETRFDSRKLFISIASQIAAKSPSFGATVDLQIQEDPSILNAPLSVQFEKLLAKHFFWISSQLTSLGKSVIIVQGLDKFEMAAQWEIVDIIARSVRGLANPFRWLITSSPGTHVIGVTDVNAKGSIRFLPLGRPGLASLLDHCIPDAFLRVDKNVAYNNLDIQPIPSRMHLIITKATKWALDASQVSAKPILWIYGKALDSCRSIYDAFERTESSIGSPRLCAFLFFSNLGQGIDTNRIFPSIAYLIAARIPSFAEALDKRIQENPNIFAESLSVQFEELFAKPLDQTSTGFEGPFTKGQFIILDGFDRCAGRDTQSRIIEIVKQSVVKRTLPFRWIISSDLEAHIVCAMTANSSLVHILPLGPPDLNQLRHHSMIDAFLLSWQRRSASKCHPGTRRDHISTITNWATGTSDRTEPVLWMAGPFGAGKSSISQTCAELLNSKRKLGASLFFSRPNQRQNPSLVFTSIAYQIALSYHHFGHAIERRIKCDPQILRKSLSIQFRELLIAPLSQIVGDLHQVDKLVIVLDGLDEIEGNDAQCDIIEIIARSVRERTTPFRWFVTSRAEPHIQRSMGFATIFPFVFRISLPVSSDTDLDIRVYLTDELTKIVLPRVSEGEVSVLVSRAGGLFVYAATVVRSVRAAVDPRAQLHAFIENSHDVRSNTRIRNPLAEMDMPYTLILQQIPTNTRITACQILLLNELHVGDTCEISCILNISERELWDVCGSLHAVLEIRGYAIHFHHASFMEFMKSPPRSGRFCIFGDTLVQLRQDMLKRIQTIHDCSEADSFDFGHNLHPATGSIPKSMYIRFIRLLIRTCTIPDCTVDDSSAHMLAGFEFHMIPVLMGNQCQKLLCDYVVFRNNIPSGFRESIISPIQYLPEHGCEQFILGRGAKGVLCSRDPASQDCIFFPLSPTSPVRRDHSDSSSGAIPTQGSNVDTEAPPLSSLGTRIGHSLSLPPSSGNKRLYLEVEREDEAQGSMTFSYLSQSQTNDSIHGHIHTGEVLQEGQAAKKARR